MNIFKDVIFSWWQVGMLKLSLFVIGLAAGAYYAEVILPYVWHLLIVGVVLGLYLTVVWCRQP